MHIPSLGLLGALLLVGALPAEAQSLRPAGPPTLLHADAAPALRPVWSPDGARLAFTRDAYAGLWVVGRDGGDARPLTDAPAAGFGFAWAPDGQALLARTARTEGLRRYHTVALVGLDGTVRALTPERAQMPALPRWAGPHHVAVMAADGAVETVAASDAARTAAPEPVAVARPAGGLAVADPAAGALRPAGPYADATVLNVTPSPDGSRVAFEVLGGPLVVADRDGGNAVELGRGERPTWSPDGRWVAFMVTEDDGHEITGADLVAARTDGSARVALTATPDRLEMNPSWSPDGRALAYDDAADGALYLLPLAE